MTCLQIEKLNIYCKLPWTEKSTTVSLSRIVTALFLVKAFMYL